MPFRAWALVLRTEPRQAGSRPFRASIPIAGAPPASRRFAGRPVARSPRVVSRFVSWDHREYLSEYSVDGLPGMTEQSGSRPEPAGLPFP